MPFKHTVDIMKFSAIRHAHELQLNENRSSREPYDTVQNITVSAVRTHAQT